MPARTKLFSFGTVATLLELIPLASIFFSFSNTGKLSLFINFAQLILCQLELLSGLLILRLTTLL